MMSQSIRVAFSLLCLLLLPRLLVAMEAELIVPEEVVPNVSLKLK